MTGEKLKGREPGWHGWAALETDLCSSLTEGDPVPVAGGLGPLLGSSPGPASWHTQPLLGSLWQRLNCGDDGDVSTRRQLRRTFPSFLPPPASPTPTAARTRPLPDAYQTAWRAHLGPPPGMEIFTLVSSTPCSLSSHLSAHPSSSSSLRVT